MIEHSQTRRKSPLANFAQADAIVVLGFVLCVLATLAFWTQMQPFRSLQDYSAVQDTTQSNELRKYTTLIISGLFMLFLWADGNGRRIFDVARSPVIVAVFGWALLTCLISANPSLALNRLVLAAIAVQVAYAVPFLFRDASRLIDALGLCATILITASYLGVLFLPDLAIHAVRDVTEQTLAGNWRGIFGHKNDLSSMAALFVFLGILVARTNSRVWGIAIVLASVVLLIMSEGKTATLLTIPALFFGLLIVHMRSMVLTTLLACGLIVTIVFFTLGGVLSADLATVFEGILPDPSFTGRTDAWKIALEAIGQSPLVGYGYVIFWDLGMAHNMAVAASVIGNFDHAHNAFLDVILSVGLIGLFFVLVWTVVLPLRHIHRIRPYIRNGTESALAGFLVNVWLFGMMNASLEAILFNRSNPIWYTVLVAMGCLHAWAQSLPIKR
ncbi:O-antigen ligase [Neorhizobium sp. JUb45]|uniref:O-antigen ligase family protein n=1 Tax=unclassified Neorhizobium TaxID=2629175 RepID=UPI001048384A|nr:O-antigen ligase [Neorhizobium sp. JUb45]TCR06058.1 O-antigen ligase [Neorhizobium sp. JUb45]